MSAPAPKSYQREAVQNALEIFRYAEGQLQAATDESSRMAASAYNGCVLLEAPTGSGKTLMAGMIAEEFSRFQKHRHNAKIIWFWFTPFANLVGQSVSDMKSQFQGLRIRDLYSERRVSGMASGDVFVTTWASVAASNKDTRKIRMDGDLAVSLDGLIPQLREMGFRIGVAVDESHHGFTKATEAVKFYREVMRPDFTLLITATPDDADIKKFKEAASIAHLHRIRVSRKDSVDAGLIKEGVKSVAYIAPEDQKQLVDFGLTALADGWKMHGAIKDQLKAEGIDLTPLMLVQVGNSDSAVEEARKRLKAIGVPDDAVAWYTSNDPNDDLQAVARDETKQVLIFKVAVALGFNAPRAFTLVSMRGAQDTNFGIQVVGRILRVHPKLQAGAVAKNLPELLRFGYVLLADSENQTGLTSAGEKINAIKTEMSGICPYTMVVQVAGENQVQVVQDGKQPSFLAQQYKPADWKPPLDVAGGVAPAKPLDLGGLLSGLVLTMPEGPGGFSESGKGDFKPLPGNIEYLIKPDVPRVFKKEVSPLSTVDLVRCIGASVAIDDKVFAAGMRQNINVTRKEVDIFDSDDQEVALLQARLSDTEIARRAQGVLFEAEQVDPRDLFEELLKRLKKEYGNRGIPASEAELIRALNLIMATYPNLVKRAARTCAAKYREIVNTARMPEKIDVPPGAKKSRLNIYGVMPQDLNNPEAAFAEMLDNDLSGVVEWWFRNEPRKPWSIGIVMPNGSQYFPDFAVKVKDRTLGEGLLLVEIKGNHILNGDDTLDKVIAEHKVYGCPLMLVQEQDGRFMTVRYNLQHDKNEMDQIFRVENMGQY